MEAEKQEQTPALASLPPEIMSMIANHLPLVDVACLALCNHTTSSILCGAWDTLDAFPSDRQVFLNRLAADLPPFYFCHFCSILHPRDCLDPPGPTVLPKRPLNSHEGRVSSLRPFLVHPELDSLYSFYHYHLQLAMKRHYYGPDHGISTDSLLFTEVHRQKETSTTSLLSLEARVCSGPCLCLRIQTWAAVETRSIDRLILNINFVFLCDHVGMRRVGMRGQDPIMPPLVRSAFTKSKISKQRGLPFEPDVFNCRACGADYQVEVRALDRNRLAIVTTKWINLGAGLDPDDIRWKKNSQIQRSVDLDAVRSSKETLSLFEDADGPSLDSLTQKNESYLLNDSYMYSLDHWHFRIWMMQGGKHGWWFHFSYKVAGIFVQFLLLWPWWTGAAVLYLSAYWYNVL
ncbi:F-box domain-containing protein [Trichophyton equinum CBS 127.97]|uniref:F-box domain-containing protein n=1 Tax=Trichophyton equinum (strain ATCC MYA-4606 / CBS 127.97) TaxID=559882 RepID=F2PYC8_TRIEC|nr:F-box domain-containing protein [Trichophyton equinum CBS 127.97]